MGEDAERAVSGSFRAPGAGASGSDAGVTASALLDAGVAPSGAGGGSSSVSGPVTLQQVYEATCDGATVQWGFFTFRAATPGDSSIVFRVRTAATEAELAGGTYRALLTASAALGIDRCGFTGPAPCPIDLYEVLGGSPLAHHPFAELQVQLSPARDPERLPVVEEWQLTFSCTFNQ